MCVSCLSFIASHTWKNYSERSSVHHLLKTCEDYKRSCLLSVRTCLLVPGMHACQGRLQTVMKIKDLISIVGLHSPFWHIHHNKTKPYTYLLQSVVFTEPCLPWLWLFMLIWICLINCFWLYPSDDISSWQHPLCLMEDEGGILRRGATPLTNCHRFLKINKTIAGIDKTHSFFFLFFCVNLEKVINTRENGFLLKVWHCNPAIPLLLWSVASHSYFLPHHLLFLLFHDESTCNKILDIY